MTDEGSKFSQLMTKKGPMDLPIGVWILIGGGGLYFAYRTYRKAGSSPDVATTGTTGNGTVDATGMGSYAPAGANANSGSASTGSTSTGFADNNQWASAAINYLVGLGYDPGLANQAIGNYLASQPQPSTQYQSMVNVAVQHLGAPPQAIAPVNGDVPPTQGGSSGATDVPGAITNLGTHVYANYTNLTWNNPANTDYVKIGADNLTTGWPTTYTDVPTFGITGMTGHEFSIDQLTRGHRYRYSLTPVNSKGSGPTATIEATNAP